MELTSRGVQLHCPPEVVQAALALTGGAAATASASGSKRPRAADSVATTGNPPHKKRKWRKIEHPAKQWPYFPEAYSKTALESLPPSMQAAIHKLRTERLARRRRFEFMSSCAMEVERDCGGVAAGVVGDSGGSSPSCPQVVQAVPAQPPAAPKPISADESPYTALYAAERQRVAARLFALQRAGHDKSSSEWRAVLTQFEEVKKDFAERHKRWLDLYVPNVVPKAQLHEFHDHNDGTLDRLHLQSAMVKRQQHMERLVTACKNNLPTVMSKGNGPVTQSTPQDLMWLRPTAETAIWATDNAAQAAGLDGSSSSSQSHVYDADVQRHSLLMSLQCAAFTHSTLDFK